MKKLFTTLFLVVTVPLIVWATGLYDYLRDTERLRADVQSLGPAAPFAFVLGHSLLEGLGVPSTFLVLAAMLLWAKPTAFVICVIGSTGASIVGFWLARALAGDWVMRRMPPTMRRWESSVSRHPFIASLAMRSVLFLAPGPAYVMGLSHGRFLPCLAGAAIGCIPGLFATIYYGPELVHLARAVPPAAWGVVALAAIAGGLLWARQRARAGTPEAAADVPTDG